MLTTPIPVARGRTIRVGWGPAREWYSTQGEDSLNSIPCVSCAEHEISLVDSKIIYLSMKVIFHSSARGQANAVKNCRQCYHELQLENGFYQ